MPEILQMPKLNEKYSNRIKAFLFALERFYDDPTQKLLPIFNQNVHFSCKCLAQD
jgi:hypothetical protein